jgi:acetyl-CoA carboxylase biotin carboxyl carrier protein
MPSKTSPSPIAPDTGNLDLPEITQIIDLMSKNDISLFSLDRGGNSITLRRGHDIDAIKDVLAMLPAQSSSPVFYGGGAPAQAAAPAPAAPAALAAPAKIAEPAAGPTINSPMVGTLYRSSGPGEKAFINVGDHVDANTTVCIIEAMKVMNEIKAETSGTIARIIAQDGKPVQYGQPLFELK